MAAKVSCVTGTVRTVALWLHHVYTSMKQRQICVVMLVECAARFDRLAFRPSVTEVVLILIASRRPYKPCEKGQSLFEIVMGMMALLT